MAFIGVKFADCFELTDELESFCWGLS